MKLSKASETDLRRTAVLVLLMALPVLGWAQHDKKPSSPPPAPAPKASAPAQHANAPSQHSASPNQASAPNHMGPGSNPHAGTANTGRPGVGNAGKSGPGGAAKPGAATNGRPGTAMNAKPGVNANAGKPGGMSKTAMNRTPPGRQVALKGGGTAHIRPNGQIRSVNRNGMQIQHGLHGGRTVVSTHNGARVVTTGKHAGYVQRAYVTRNGYSYVSRTTVVNNVTYTSVYRSYGYGGYCCYYGYAPAYYYHPVYYGWAYNPWPAPAYYSWGWGGAPWYGYYGPYYAPYPVYPSAAFWLTDYMFAASLQAAYAAQMEANASLLDPSTREFLVASMIPMAPADDAKGVALSAEAKQAVADEVKAQLADEQAEAEKKGASGGQTNGPPPALDPKRKTFVVADEVTMVVDGDECSLTAGDVLSRTSETPDEDRNVTVKVLASKKADCGVGKEGAIAVDDLQEMHNKFREQLSSGMKELAQKQGKDGLPKAPDTSTTDGEIPAPPPDKSAAKALEDQQHAADQTETEVKQEAASSTSGGAQ